MSSFVNTLRSCHSTVRTLRKSSAPISGLVRPLSGEASDVLFLRCEVVAGVLGSLADRLSPDDKGRPFLRLSLSRRSALTGPRSPPRNDVGGGRASEGASRSFRAWRATLVGVGVAVALQSLAACRGDNVTPKGSAGPAPSTQPSTTVKASGQAPTTVGVTSTQPVGLDSSSRLRIDGIGPVRRNSSS